MKLLTHKGTTSKVVEVFIQDNSLTTGGGLTGLTYNSLGLTAYYFRDTGTTSSAISLASMSLGTWISGGFKEIDATNMPGWYQFCLPNGALASGANDVVIHLFGATNMAPCPIEIQLTNVDYDASTFDTNLLTWLGSTPSALTSNGYVQSMLLRWLTDNAGGTPNALSSGLVQSDLYKAAGTTITAGDFVDFLLRLKAALIPTAGTVNDAGATTTSFITDLASGVDDFYAGDTLIFTTGSLAGQSRHISSYAQSTKTVTLISALTSSPANGVSFTLSSSSHDLQLVKQDTASTLSRLGAFTGSGANTVLGLLQSLFRDDATLPSDIGGTYDNTTMSLEALYAKIIHLPEGLARGVPYDNFKFILRVSTNHITPATGITVVAQRSIDDGAFESCDNSVVEMSNGAYKIDLSADDLDGTSIMLYFTGIGADPAFYVLKTT